MGRKSGVTVPYPGAWVKQIVEVERAVVESGQI
jgi:hypothetical protein